MPITISTPPMAQGSTESQLAALRSYLFDAAQELQWAFDNVSTAGAGGGAKTAQGGQQGGQQAGQKTPQETFSSIKNLIIKSADIVNAYGMEIEKQLRGVYVSDSDFGKYKEATSATIRATDKNIQQLYTDTQQISGTLDSLYDQVNQTNAYIKTGYLADDASGQPIYGLEIGQQNQVDGQKTFDKFARFSAGRLSFFDENSTEVAYVSDYKLYITNAEITGALQLSGKFKVYYNNGLAFQWQGGGA